MTAERGYVDQVINPADTRAIVCTAFRTLRSKIDLVVPRKTTKVEVSSVDGADIRFDIQVDDVVTE